MLCQYGQFYNILFYQLTTCLFLKYLFVSFVYLNFPYMYQLRLWWCFFLYFYVSYLTMSIFTEFTCIISLCIFFLFFFNNTLHAPFDNGFLYNIYKNHLTMWCFLLCLFYNIYMCHFMSLYSACII